MRISGVLLTSCLAGCAYAPLRRDAIRQPQPLPAEIAAYYGYPAHTHEAVTTLLGRHDRYSEYLIRFPFSAPADLEPTEPVVEFEWYESRRPGRGPAILFNPILGGDYPLERGVCRMLARHGFHVALVHRKTLKVSPEHDIAHLELLLRQGVIRIRQVVDWMSADDAVDASRMGSFGISMGGIATVMTAAVEPRLRAHMVALAGGSIADVLVSSKDRLLTKPRALYLSKNRMDLPTFERLVRAQVKTDPIRLAPYVDRRQLILFIALADRTIGRANALRLRRALGRPETIFMPFGHYTAYLSLPYLEYESLRFFKERLG